MPTTYVPPALRGKEKDKGQATKDIASRTPTLIYNDNDKYRPSSKNKRTATKQHIKVPIRNAPNAERAVLVDLAGEWSASEGARGFLLGFEEYESETYSHLRGQQLYVLKTIQRNGADDSSFSRNRGRMEGTTDDEESLTSLNEGFMVADSGLTLEEKIRERLGVALDIVHDHTQALSEGVLSSSSVDRVKLLIRFGRLMFFEPNASSSAGIMWHRPFSAEEIEGSFAGKHTLDVKLRKTLETKLASDVFARYEEHILSSCDSSPRYSEKVTIQVEDKEHLDLQYKVICRIVKEPNPNFDPTAKGDSELPDAPSPYQRLVLQKVKRQPTRYAVIDVVRPEREMDFRIMLTTETTLTRLDEETRVAIGEIVQQAVVDHTIRGSLRWPANFLMEDGNLTMMGGRFSVRGVRCNRKIRCMAGGMVWKLSRINGSDLKLSGGRVTKEIEFWPLLWYQKLKGLEDKGDGGEGNNGLNSSSQVGFFSSEEDLGRKSQESLPPSWTSEELMGMLPSVLKRLSIEAP